MTEDVPQDTEGAAKTAPRAPAPPRPKLTLEEQAIFIGWLLDRCRMLSPAQRGAFRRIGELRAFDRVEVCGPEEPARALARAMICSATWISFCCRLIAWRRFSGPLLATR